MRVRACGPAEARRQAHWITAMEPWRSLGYRAEALARWLGRAARAGQVWVAAAPGDVHAVLVVQPDVLLGDFIALLAVRPATAGQGLGRRLVEHAATRTFRRRRWLYTSSDASNAPAARFYRRLGFQRIARLPAMVRPDRTEILWRLPRPTPATPTTAPR